MALHNVGLIQSVESELNKKTHYLGVREIVQDEGSYLTHGPLGFDSNNLFDQPRPS